MDLSRSTAATSTALASTAWPDIDPITASAPPWATAGTGAGLTRRRGARVRPRAHRPRRMRRRDRLRLDRELGTQALPAPLLDSIPAQFNPAAAPVSQPITEPTVFDRAAALLESWDAAEPPHTTHAQAVQAVQATQAAQPDAIDLSDGPHLLNRPPVPGQRRAEPGTTNRSSAPGTRDAAPPTLSDHDHSDAALTKAPGDPAPADQAPADQAPADDPMADRIDTNLAAALEAELAAPLALSAGAAAARPAITSELAEPLLAVMLAIVGSIVALGTIAPAAIWMPLVALPAIGLFAITMPGGTHARLSRAVALLAAGAVLPTLSSAMTPVTLLIAVTVVATYPLLTAARSGRMITWLGPLSLLIPLVTDALRTGVGAFFGSFASSGSSTVTATRLALTAGIVVVTLIGMSSMATRRILIGGTGRGGATLGAQHRSGPARPVMHEQETVAAQDFSELKQPAGDRPAPDAAPGTTSLSTRKALLRHLSVLLSDPAAASASAGVAVIELDRFDALAASIGADAADDVATQVGLRLRACLPGEQLVARIRAHQYAVALSHASTKTLADLGKAVATCLQQPIAVAGQSDISVTCSLGTSVATADLDTAAALLDAADEAVRAAQVTGRSRTVMFDQAVRAHAQSQASLEVELRAAISAGTIGAVYQPLLALGTGDDDDRIVGAEAMADWTRADGSVVPPERFLPMADDLGLAGTLSMQVLELALDALLDWRSEGVGVDQVWVNLAASQLSDPALARDISSHLARRGLSPSCLVIEVGAGALMESDEALASLRMLRSLGVAIALDEFGRTGTSLTSLRSLPISAVKVDPRLGADLGSQDAVPRSIIQLCHSLGLRVVVEGIETLTQLHGAREVEADAVQGYAVARPLPPHDVTNLLSLRLPREFRLR
jgi:diguanylate cyclase (GGDEF)-like protein